MIYLLHSTVPVGGTGTHSARHYMGFAPDATWRKRITLHKTGRSHVKIVDAFLAQKGQLLVVAVLPGGTRTDERSLKRAGHLARLCPLCNHKRKVGEEGGLVCLIPRKPALTRQSVRHAMETGGVSPVPSSTEGTTPPGQYLHERIPVRTTLSGDEVSARDLGGRRWTATAPPSPQGSTLSAGTRQPSSCEDSDG